jgi:hypothetical protein
MSNAFAIAAVTACLRRLIHERLTAAATETDALPSGFSVTSVPPDSITVGSSEVPRINLFLVEVSPNTGWSSHRMPERDGNGARVSIQPLALNLHYLVSAYGAENLDAETLLGHALQVLHENPGLSRGQIRDLLDPADTVTEAGTPQKFREQAVALADQFELIKLTPHFLAVDEMSKIWSSLQAHFRSSVVYQATVVLIESRRPARTPLPVLTRGLGDVGVRLQPDLLPPVPTLLIGVPPNRQPAVRPVQVLKVFGHHLVGTNLRVSFRHLTLGLELIGDTVLPDPGVVVRGPDPSGTDAAESPQIPADADTCLELDLEEFTGTWAAGLHSLEATLTLPGDTNPRTSNRLAIAIAPRFVTSGADAPVVTDLGSGRYRIRIKVEPTLRPGQAASLILGQSELLAPPITAPTARVDFEGPLPITVVGTTQLARLRVDGVESQFIDRPEDAPPEFVASQQIAIP